MPYLGFARSKLAFSDYVSPDDIEYFRRFELATIQHDDSVLFVLADERITNFEQLLADKPKPHWLDFFEILEITSRMASAPPSYYDEDVDDYPEYGPSRSLAEIINDTSGFEKPSFQKRMLAVTFDDDLETAERQKAETQIRKALGSSAIGLWHGRDFTAYGFVDGRDVNRIAASLSHLLRKNISDYLVCEPVQVTESSALEISPLAHWASVGWRKSA